LYDVVVSGDFAYAAAGNSGLLIFDVRNPARPRLHGFYDGAGDTRSIHVDGQHAFVMDRTFGLSVFDVSDPVQPRRVGGNPNVGDLEATSVATDVTAAGDKLYVLAGERGLFVMDLFQALRLEPASSQVPGTFGLVLHGPSGLTGRIQRSDSLGKWEDWRAFTIGSAPPGISDPDAGSKSQRFYRAVVP
jgi:hypothetical protein